MKTVLLRVACVLMALAPMCAAAQSNITKAFDNLLKSSDVVYTEKHSLDKDAATGVKESQYDIYTFTLPEKKMSLIDNVAKAFRADADKAYSFNSGVADASDPTLVLAVGNGDTGGVRVSWPGRQYVYAAFLAPKSENPSGNYRYGYAMNWVKENNKIQGQLIVTYATTLKYRQSQSSSFNVISPNISRSVSTSNGTTTVTTITGDNGTITMTNDGTSTVSSEGDWFTTFMNYVQALTTGNPATRQGIATKIYQLTQKERISSVSSEDKSVARGILNTLISDSNTYDAITRRLLSSAISNIK